MTPPPSMERNVAVSPDTMTEAMPWEPVPTGTIVSFAIPDEIKAPEAAEVGAGSPFTPAPAVAFDVPVASAVVKAALLPVPNAATGVGNATPAPPVMLNVDVPEMTVVVPFSTMVVTSMKADVRPETGCGMMTVCGVFLTVQVQEVAYAAHQALEEAYTSNQL